MSNAIEFLERMGQDAALRHASDREIQNAMLAMQVGPELQAAILRKDSAGLEALTGAIPNTCCIVAPVEGEDLGSRDS